MKSCLSLVTLFCLSFSFSALAGMPCQNQSKAEALKFVIEDRLALGESFYGVRFTALESTLVPDSSGDQFTYDVEVEVTKKKTEMKLIRVSLKDTGDNFCVFQSADDAPKK